MRKYVIGLKGKQFGRHAEVAIKNFETGKEYTVDNRYEISFEFFKTIDETDNNSTGRVQIKGISKESFKEIKSEGGEIRLTCGYTNTEIKTLFVATIVNMSLKFDGNQNILEINCSANMQYYYLTPYKDVPYEELTPVELIKKFSNLAGGAMQIDLLALPKEYHAVAEEFFTTALYKVDYFGDPKIMLAELATLFGMEVSAVPTESASDTYPIKYVFVLKTTGVKELIRMINDGYPKINRTAQEKQSLKDDTDFKAIFLTPNEEYKKAWFLSYQTGLISFQDEFKVVNTLVSKNLAANETETIKSLQRSAIRTEKEKKQALDDLRRKSEGKKVQVRKPKVNYRQVTRQFVKIRALLNPSVRPQAHVMLVEESEFRLFRVRDVTFRGNNHQGDWIMDLSCEDSDGRYDRYPTEAEIQAMQQNYQVEESQNGEGNFDQVENDTSYGGE